MRSSRLILATLSAAAAALLAAGTASATHKSWYLTDPGANCRANLSGSASWFVFNDGAITNNTSSGNSVTCPITLAGRFQSQPGPSTFPSYASFSLARWAAADHGTLWGFDASSSDNFSCRAWVFGSTGSSYYGDTFAPAAVNSGVTIEFIPPGGTWAGIIGDGSAITARAMGYECWLPPGSSIYGYRVNICQRDSGCHE